MQSQRSEPANVDAAGSPASIRIQRRIEWADTDASGAYHNSAAFGFMEAAETALIERLGFLDDVYGRHPRVHIEADFLRPLWFRDLVDVDLTVEAVGRTSVAYAVEIRKDGEPCARGRLVAVLLDGIGGSPTPWPQELRDQLLTAGRQAPELLVTRAGPEANDQDPAGPRPGADDDDRAP